MYASYNSLTLPPLLKLFYLPFYKRGSRGGFFFLWLGARHNKRGNRELGGTRVLEDQRRASSDIPLAAAGAAGWLPTHVNQV